MPVNGWYGVVAGLVPATSNVKTQSRIIEVAGTSPRPRRGTEAKCFNLRESALVFAAALVRRHGVS
jgi:hypothetical protein